MILRGLMKKDAVFMLEWMRNKDITDLFQFDFESISINKCESFIARAQRDCRSLHLAIVDDNDEYMGTVSLKNIDFINKNSEYAIVLRNEAIGKGYAKVATDMILYIAFSMLHLHKVYLNVFEDNARANKFYEKYGFIKEGKFIDSMFIRGTYKNIIWYRILRVEYDNKYIDKNKFYENKYFDKIENHIKKLAAKGKMK